MNLTDKNQPLTLSLNRRTKSLVNNSFIPQDYQSNTQLSGRKSVYKLIEKNPKHSQHNKVIDLEEYRTHNPEDDRMEKGQIKNNLQAKRRHVRLLKRKKGNNQSYKNSQIKNLDKKSSINTCALDGKQESTLNKLVQMSIKHHDPSLCVCAYCSCGRHLCKVHLTKPYSSQQFSSYNSDYNKKKPIQDLKFKLLNSFKGQQTGIDPQSFYTKEYSSKQTELSSMFLPQDLLHVGGPFDGKTTYVENYPKHNSQRTELMRPLGGKIENFPFSGNTHYQKQYSKKQAKKSQQIIASGNMKLGEAWTGKSTYSNVYTIPSKDFVEKWKSKLSELPRPKYEGQFETVYKNNYIPLKSTVCPAIPQLFTKSKFMSCPKIVGSFAGSQKIRATNKQTI